MQTQVLKAETQPYEWRIVVLVLTIHDIGT